MLDCRSKGPRFDPRLGHEGFLQESVTNGAPCWAPFVTDSYKNFHAPAEDRTRDVSIFRRALYHAAIKTGLYRKEVQVYDIPKLYPVTLVYTVAGYGYGFYGTSAAI